MNPISIHFTEGNEGNKCPEIHGFFVSFVGFCSNPDRNSVDPSAGPAVSTLLEIPCRSKDGPSHPLSIQTSRAHETR
jgi:hypothetical protein